MDWLNKHPPPEITEQKLFTSLTCKQDTYQEIQQDAGRSLEKTHNTLTFKSTFELKLNSDGLKQFISIRISLVRATQSWSGLLLFVEMYNWGKKVLSSCLYRLPKSQNIGFEHRHRSRRRNAERASEVRKNCSPYIWSYSGVKYL